MMSNETDYTQISLEELSVGDLITLHAEPNISIYLICEASEVIEMMPCFVSARRYRKVTCLTKTGTMCWFNVYDTYLIHLIGKCCVS